MINVNDSITNGTVSSNKSEEYYGAEIFLNIVPNDNYKIKAVKIKNKNSGVDETIEVSYNSSTKKFIMPDHAVLVDVEFEPNPITTYTITFDVVNGVTFDKTSPITVNSGSNQEVEIKAVSGYRLTSVKVGGVEKLPLINNKLTLTNITANQTIVVTAEKIIYDVLDGENQKFTIGTEKNLVVRIDADYNLFSKLYLNDEELNPEFYTITEGSTIITLKQNFVNNLLSGTYNLRAIFSDGGEANTTFEIVNAKTNPKTGDNILYSILFGSISLIVLFGTSIYLKKKDLTKNKLSDIKSILI